MQKCDNKAEAKLRGGSMFNVVAGGGTDSSFSLCPHFVYISQCKISKKLPAGVYQSL